MSLYCLKKDMVFKGKRTIVENFYADEATVRESFNGTKAIKIFTRDITLYEIDTKGIGFTDPKVIEFERYKVIDFDSYELK